MDPFTAAAIGTAVFGAGSSIAGARSANKTAARATQEQSRLSAQQFDTRNALARDVFSENMALSRGAYDALNALDDQEFAARTGLTKETFNQLNEIERDQIVRDAVASDANLAEVAAARAQYTSDRDSARAAYNAELEGANARQDQYRSRADDVSRALIGTFTPSAVSADYSGAVGRRVGAQNYAANPPMALPTNRLSDQTRMAYERSGAKGQQFAVDQGVRSARLEALDDVFRSGSDRINRANENVSFIQDAATRALAPVGARLDAQSLRFNNAADARAGRLAGANANLDAAINLSAQRAQGAARPVQAYSGAMDTALGGFYGDRRASVGGAAEAKVGANNALLGGANSASSGFEGTMQGITDYRIRNGQNNFWNAAGQFASAIAPVFSMVGQRQSVAAPGATTTAPTTTAWTRGTIPGIVTPKGFK